MAFSNITGLSLGDILQIYYSDGIRVQISKDFKDWEYIKREKVSDPKGRQIDFYLQTSLGPSAVQRRNPGVVSNFPTSQRVSSSEHTAVVKEINATIELDYNLWKRAEMSKDVRYSEPLQIEMEAKLCAIKRQLSLELHLDGTGVMAQVGEGATPATVNGSGSGSVTVSMSVLDSARGHVGACSFDEILVLKANDGTASAITFATTTPTYWIVTDRDFTNETVTMQGLDANLATVALTSGGANDLTVQPAAGEVFYKYGQPTIPDLTSISDYGTATEVMPGFESLTANDGRVVHGITMSGATKGTRLDAQGDQFDTSHIEDVLNNAKINTGESAYSWKQMCIAPKVYSQFVNGRETDRRFNSVEDTARGARKWTYQHRDDTIELQSSEFAKNRRAYIMPESKQGQGKVFEYHGTDFMPVKAPNGSEFHLKAASGTGGGFENTIVSYMDSYGTLICKHPAAVAVISGFTIA